MNIDTTLTTKDKIRNLNTDEQKAGDNVMRQCLGVKQTDSVLIVTDPAKLETEAAVFFESAKAFTDQLTLISFTGMTENAQEPPALVLEAMLKSTTIICPTTYSLTHTKARKQACLSGARVITLPGITLDMITRTLRADYSTIAFTTLKLAPLLQGTTSVSITSSAGTNLNIPLDPKRAWITDTGIFTKPSDYGNLPAGEIFTAPLENQALGTLIVDGSFAGLTLDSPITLTLSAGKITSISGGQAATRLTSILEKLDPKARIIAELGIGTNPATNPKGDVLEAEKALGTCHIAFGNNITFGGTTNVPFHSDGVILKPTLTLNTKKTIINQGKLAI